MGSSKAHTQIYSALFGNTNAANQAKQLIHKPGIIQKNTKRIVIQDPTLLEKLAKGEIDVGQLKINRS